MPATTSSSNLPRYCSSDSDSDIDLDYAPLRMSHHYQFGTTISLSRGIASDTDSEDSAYSVAARNGHAHALAFTPQAFMTHVNVVTQLAHTMASRRLRNCAANNISDEALLRQPMILSARGMMVHNMTQEYMTNVMRLFFTNLAQRNLLPLLSNNGLVTASANLRQQVSAALWTAALNSVIYISEKAEFAAIKAYCEASLVNLQNVLLHSFKASEGKMTPHVESLWFRYLYLLQLQCFCRAIDRCLQGQQLRQALWHTAMLERDLLAQLDVREEARLRKLYALPSSAVKAELNGTPTAMASNAWEAHFRSAVLEHELRWQQQGDRLQANREKQYARFHQVINGKLDHILRLNLAPVAVDSVTAPIFVHTEQHVLADDVFSVQPPPAMPRPQFCYSKETYDALSELLVPILTFMLNGKGGAFDDMEIEEAMALCPILLSETR